VIVPPVTADRAVLAAAWLNQAAARSVLVMEGYLSWPLSGALTAACQRLPARLQQDRRRIAVRRARRTTRTVLTLAATASTPALPMRLTGRTGQRAPRQFSLTL
jgi:hypothetical protein